jgi:cell division transport system permease protein
MSFTYTFKESFSGFSRTKLASAVSIATICISLLLLGLFAVITVNAARFVQEIRNRVELEVFLQEPVSQEGIESLQRTVAGLEGVASLVFVSKDEAARVFREEFGEDILSVLDFNPLPPSFRIALKPSHTSTQGTRGVSDRIASLPGVESVVYRKALIELIDKRTESVNSITLWLGVLISLSAILLVSNTIRLAIYAKRRLIETMELVGATWGFIRLPFVVEGMVQGLIGGVLASGILYTLVEYALPAVAADLAVYVRMDTYFYVLVLVAGTALGLLGSLISVFRFIRPAASR